MSRPSSLILFGAQLQLRCAPSRSTLSARRVDVVGGLGAEHPHPGHLLLGLMIAWLILAVTYGDRAAREVPDDDSRGGEAVRRTAR